MTRIPTRDGIVKRYLHDEVADRLRALILSGELEPLSRVNEVELAARFGISRTPLREAIKILATEGLLELLPNRGARVAALSEAEVADMLEVVAGLEAMAAELACRNIDDEGLEAIERLHEQMVAARARDDVDTYFARNKDIHDALMRASGNPVLQRIYASLAGRVQRARFRAPKTTEQWDRAVREHAIMVRLLRRRSGIALGELMRRHIRGKNAVIRAAYGPRAAAKSRSGA